MSKFFQILIISLLFCSCKQNKEESNDIRKFGLKWLSLSENTRIAIPANTCLARMNFTVKDSLLQFKFTSSGTTGDYFDTSHTKLTISIAVWDSVHIDSAIHYIKLKNRANCYSCFFQPIIDEENEYYFITNPEESTSFSATDIIINYDDNSVFAHDYFTRKKLNFDSLRLQMNKMLQINSYEKFRPFIKNFINR
ncbi:MAG TPA: hypothetical protein DIU39_06640 [Flavobacteriales bacterium]|nr:hypothetical protein [Flavobacteriales bacterium]|tara:strand:- start:141595 stop:142179 length:585 start_codon:yes stop_codon:yes gene_type:complete